MDNKYVNWGSNRIKVITRKLCGGCNELKEALKEKNIPFDELEYGTLDGTAAWAYYGGYSVFPILVVGYLTYDGTHTTEELIERAMR